MEQKLVLEFFKKDRFAVENGMELLKAGPGFAQARLVIDQRHMNGYGTVQGGVIFTLADYAFAAASNSKGNVTVSCSANISYFHPPKGSFITANATEVSSGRRLCTYNVDILDEDGSLVARFTSNGYIKNEKAFEEN